MQDLISTKELKMSSREVASLTEKRHDHVLRDIRTMFSKLGTAPKFGEVSSGPQDKEFFLDQFECLCLVSGYDTSLRMKIIKRWHELENKPPENPLLQLANAVLTAQKVIDDQSSRLALAEPKAAAFDLISEAEGELCLTDAAKHLQIKPNQLTKWLQVNGWIYKRAGSKSWIAYQQRIDQGLLIHRRATFTRTSGAEDYSWQALVTPKGISVLAKKQTIKGFIKNENS